MFPCALPNPVKVSFGKWRGRLIRRLQEPSFRLRRNCEWLAPLVAHAAKHVIRQLAGIASDAASNLLSQEVLNVFGQSNGHEEWIPLGGDGAKAKGQGQIAELERSRGKKLPLTAAPSLPKPSI